MRKHALQYILFFLCNVILVDIAVYLFLSRNIKPEVKIDIGLPEKLNFYKKNKSNYNLLFVGDSRTYTNFHNPLIDSLTGLKSINMGMWANWFPTQYPFFQDVLKEIPDSTTIVWSIGHINFIHSTTHRQLVNTYPVKIKNLPTYLKFGFSLSDVFPNICEYDLKPIMFFQKQWISSWIQNKLSGVYLTKISDNQSLVKKPESELINLKQFEDIKSAMSLNKNVLRVKERLASDTITSAQVYWKHGNYWRIEIDSVFFRIQQKKDRVERAKNYIQKNAFDLDKRYWNNFVEIVELLKQHKERLNIIVNEFGEAPYVYQDGEKENCVKFMEKVREYLTQRGFKCVKVDFDNFVDTDYFDYNHMNNKGAIKFSRAFAPIFQQQLK